MWVDLRAAEDLVQRSLGAGVPDPFAVLELVSGGPPGQRRCASVLAATTSPRWRASAPGGGGSSAAAPGAPTPGGERFAFAVDSLPATVSVALHDWNLFGACEPLGRAEVVLEPADGTHLRADRPRVVKAHLLLGVPRGTLTFAQCMTSRTATADPGDSSALALRRRLEEGLCGARRGAGAKASAGLGDGRSGRGRPPPERFVEDFSCALVAPGDGKLRPGRMYLWEHGLIFQSSASLGALLQVGGGKRRAAERVSLEVPFANVDHVRPSSHAVLNAALSVALRAGVEDVALVGWASCSAKTGALKLKFASFWQRGRTQKVLQRLLDRSRQEAAEKAAAAAAGLAPAGFPGPGLGGGGFLRGRPEEREALAEAPFPLSPQQFWDRFWADDSTFPHDFARTCGDQDCFVGLWKWQPAGAGEAANEAGGGRRGHRVRAALPGGQGGAQQPPRGQRPCARAGAAALRSPPRRGGGSGRGGRAGPPHSDRGRGIGRDPAGRGGRDRVRVDRRGHFGGRLPRLRHHGSALPRGAPQLPLPGQGHRRRARGGPPARPPLVRARPPDHPLAFQTPRRALRFRGPLPRATPRRALYFASNRSLSRRPESKGQGP